MSLKAYRFIFSLFTAAVLCAGSLARAADAPSAPITPERYNKGPRVLFNMYSQSDLDALDKIVPGRFHQKFWQTPRSSIQHGFFKRGPTGHVKTVAGYHGEEIIVMIDGELKFTFPDSKQSFTLRKGDVFNFPNILHAGECLTDECHFMAVYSPNRPDFGPEGTPMSTKSNVAIADDDK
jgi:quercetin dioxygenase-like cupin family protein